MANTVLGFAETVASGKWYKPKFGKEYLKSASKLKFVLDEPNGCGDLGPIYHHNETIRGRVLYKAESREDIKSITADLRGQLTIEFFPMKNGKPRRYALQRVVKELFCETVTVLEGPFTVSESTMDLPFEFKFPNHCKSLADDASNGDGHTAGPATVCAPSMYIPANLTTHGGGDVKLMVKYELRATALEGRYKCDTSSISQILSIPPMPPEKMSSAQWRTVTTKSERVQSLSSSVSFVPVVSLRHPITCWQPVPLSMAVTDPKGAASSEQATVEIRLKSLQLQLVRRLEVNDLLSEPISGDYVEGSLDISDLDVVISDDGRDVVLREAFQLSQMRSLSHGTIPDLDHDDIRLTHHMRWKAKFQVGPTEDVVEARGEFAIEILAPPAEEQDGHYRARHPSNARRLSEAVSSIQESQDDVLPPYEPGSEPPAI